MYIYTLSTLFAGLWYMQFSSMTNRSRVSYMINIMAVCYRHYLSWSSIGNVFWFPIVVREHLLQDANLHDVISAFCTGCCAYCTGSGDAVVHHGGRNQEVHHHHFRGYKRAPFPGWRHFQYRRLDDLIQNGGTPWRRSGYPTDVCLQPWVIATAECGHKLFTDVCLTHESSRHQKG